MDAATPAAAYAPRADDRQLYAVHRFQDVALSPGGARVAWVESFDDAAQVPRSVVRVLDRKVVPPTPVALGAGGAQESRRAWSPDGRTLAFVSDAQSPGPSQLYVVDGDNPRSAARALTHLPGAVQSPRFAPDGKSVAALYVEGAARPEHAASRPAVQGEADARPAVSRVVIDDVATGDLRPLTRGDLHVHEYAASPDGARFAVVGSAAPGDRHWWTSKLNVVDAVTGADRVVYEPPKQIAVPRWSPDGRSIAAVDGGTAVEAMDLAGKIDVLASSPDETLSDLSLSADGMLSAVVRASFAQPPELWTGAAGRWLQLTHVNDDAHASWGPAKRVAWKSHGRDVQGWLLAPLETDGEAPFPTRTRTRPRAPRTGCPRAEPQPPAARWRTMGLSASRFDRPLSSASCALT